MSDGTPMLPEMEEVVVLPSYISNSLFNLYVHAIGFPIKHDKYRVMWSSITFTLFFETTAGVLHLYALNILI
jgi:hypothetical protein